MHLGSQSFQRLKAHVDYCVEGGDYAGALNGLRYFVELVINEPATVGRVLASEELDRLARFVGESWRRGHPRAPAAPRAGRTVVLMTEAEGHGGHIEVTKDLVRTGALGEVTVLLTDTFGRAQDSDPGLAALPGVRIEVVRGTSSQDRLARLDDLLHELAPERIVVMVHHQDSTAIAALHAFAPAQPPLFVHHADHHLCLGATETAFRHVDLHPMGFHDCRATHGAANVYWPLVVRATGLDAAARGFMPDGHLVTGTSGREEKFVAAGYLYDYFELLPRMLQASRGRHVHIGPLSEAALGRIHAELAAAGIDAARFRHLPWVPSLATALVEQQVDLYLPSFPLGGGKSVLEAMSVGLPLLMHENYHDRLLSGVDLAYPQAWVWRTDAQLLEALARTTRAELEQQAQAARTHFESHHHPRVLAAALASGDDNAQLVGPLRPYVGNPLQAFLDRHRPADPPTEDNSFSPTDWGNLEQDVRRLSALALLLQQQVEQRPRPAPAAAPAPGRVARLRAAAGRLLATLRRRRPAG